MRKHIILGGLLFAAVIPLSAQSINQSVQVTNEYETKFADFKKQAPDLALPDSLFTFDYDFDYSVFDTPYKGSYEFTPYNVKLTPEPMKYDGNRFFLRAGAGYTFRPELDVVYTPVTKETAALSIYNFGKGYSGSWFYDFDDRLGVAGHWIMPSVGVVTWNAGYEGIFAGASDFSSAYNSGFAGLSLKSFDRSGAFFTYGLDVQARFGSENMPDGAVSQSRVRFAGYLGPVINSRYRFLLDFDFDISALKDGRPDMTGVVANSAGFRPHLEFTAGVFDIDLGARLDCVMSEGASFHIAPAAKVSVAFPKAGMRIFAAADGSTRLPDHYGLKSLNHFYVHSAATPLCMREKYNLSLGLEGVIGTYVQYDLRGGFADYANAPLDSYMGMGFADYKLAYADAGLKFKTEHFKSDASFRYNRLTSWKTASLPYAPAAFRGDFDFRYTCLNRIEAGINLQAASARKGMAGLMPEIPGYVDLGLSGEYWFNRSWAVWGKLGNLLCMEIQRHPGLVEKGPYVTLGVGLKLK